MKYNKFAFLDIETSGMSIHGDRIIEIGILRVENNQLVNTFQSLVNPQTYVSPFIEEMTGIRKEALDSAPLFEEIKDQILEMLRDCILVAHNVRFDYGFLKREFSWLGEKFSQKHCCTVKLARFLYPQWQRHNLDAVISHFQFTCESRHRAFDDAKVLWDFFQEAQKQFSPETFEEALSCVMKHTSLPATISQEDADALPETPGVYIFYGAEGMPLYVGKSINIRDRVLSHFSNDHTSSKEMQIAQQITSIETVPTAGELGALFKESVLVKELKPLYNKQLRESKRLTKLVKKETKEGYNTISLENVTIITSDEIESIVGIFRSKKQAEEFLFTVAKEHALCHKLLTIEKTKDACFMYRLGECKGACLNKELPIAYNMRFTMAFSEKKVKRWPFRGPIVIEEINQENNKKEVFIVDNWCLINIMENPVEQDEIYNLQSHNEDKAYIFDLDLYKILVRHILNKKNYKYVKVLKEGMNYE